MKIVSAHEAAKQIKSGDTVMMGGFLAKGSAEKVVDAMLETDVKDLTMIGNDTAFDEVSYGKLVVAKKVKKIITTHVGTNKETNRQFRENEVEIEFVPQGSLAEKIRCGGFGLGGALVKAGLGTPIAEGKEIIVVDGEEFLLEKPLRADVAVIYATKADKYGNLSYKGTTKLFNTVMATAADLVIVEVEEIMDGAMDPNEVDVPGLLIDYVVENKKG